MVIARFLALAPTVLVALVLVGCGSSSAGEAETNVKEAPPAGKLASGDREFRVTDLQGRELRKIVVSRRHHVFRATFAAGGEEFWVLTGRGKPSWLHIYSTSGQTHGASSRLALAGWWGGGGFLVSPDADRVAVGAASGSCEPAAVLARNGQPIRKLSDPQQDVSIEPLSWSPDGTRLLYALTRYRDSDCGRYGLQPAALMIYRPGTNREQLLAPPRAASFRSSAWSPDQRRIAVIECKNEEDWSCRLIVMDADGTARRDLGNLGIVAGEETLVWSVATNEIVSPLKPDPAGEELELWAFNAESGERRKLAESGGPFAASSDGNRIATERGLLDVKSGRRWPLPTNIGVYFIEDAESK